MAKSRYMDGNGIMPQQEFTQEQIAKLENDSLAFFLTAKFASDHIDQERFTPASTERFSMVTALYTNMGMAFELCLKTLLIKSTHESLKGHVLAKIFDKLPERIKAEMEGIFIAGPREFHIRAYQYNSKKPDPPPPTNIKDFRSFLVFLDKITLYDRRYSFEDFSRRNWWIEIDRPATIQLLENLGNLNSE